MDTAKSFQVMVFFLVTVLIVNITAWNIMSRIESVKTICSAAITEAG